MLSQYSRPHVFVLVLLLIGLFQPYVAAEEADTTAQSAPAFVGRVREIETAQLGMIQPTGLAFSYKMNLFQVVAGRRTTPAETDLLQLTPLETVAGAMRIAAQIDEPINVTFDGKRDRLLFYRTRPKQLVEVLTEAGGALDPKTLRHHKVKHFSLQNPQGMSVDPESGFLYILDAVGPRLVRVEPDAAGGFENALVTAIDLQATGMSNPRGLAWDRSSGLFYILNPATQTLYSIAPAGQVATTLDVSAIGLGNPQVLVFAPSGDLTDDPAKMSLYVADAGEALPAIQAADTQANSEDFCTESNECLNQLYLPLMAGGSEGVNAELSAIVTAAAPQNPGAIVELTLAAPTAAAAASFTSSLVRTVNTGAFSPPSPDPSGLTYLPNSNRLLTVDGEVEERVAGITHFQGANLWEVTLGGSVLRTANISRVAPTVVPMTNEPTGVTWNPGNGHYYVTDDDARRVYDLNPGGDGLIGTADDTWTSFDTLAAGSSDPEGITFDSINNRLFVADGLNMEIYEFTLSGSLVNHFDVAQYGVQDPESIEFKADTGTLYVLSNRASRIIIETTTSGALLQTLDVSAASAIAPAGLAYAPASDGSGAKRFYIVDRGIDNDANPNIIDGKLYELTTPSSSPPTLCSSGDFYLDQFGVVSYNNNNGNRNWSGSWVENVDNNSPNNGRIRITGGELRISDAPDSGQQPAISRIASLSGVTSATFSFNHRTPSSVDPNDEVRVQISNDGGASWTTLQTFLGQNTGAKSYDVSAFIAANTAIRFVITLNYGSSNEYFAVDNVQLRCN